MASNIFPIRPRMLLILCATFNIAKSSSITFGFETISPSSSHFDENTMESTVKMTLYWNTYSYQCTLNPLSNGTRTPYFCETSDLHQITECEVNSSSTLPAYGLQIDIFGGFKLDIDRIMIQETDNKNTMNTLYDIDYFIFNSEAIDIVSASTPNKNIFFQFTSNNVYFLNGSSQCTPKSISTTTYTTTSPAIKSSNNVPIVEIIKESIIIAIVAFIGCCICLLVLASKRDNIHNNGQQNEQNEQIVNAVPEKNSDVAPDNIINLVVELVDDDGDEYDLTVSAPSVIMDDGTAESYPSPPLPDSICYLGQSQPTFTINSTYCESASGAFDGSFVYLDPDVLQSAAADKGTMSTLEIPSLNTANLQMRHQMDVSDVPSLPPESLVVETSINCQDEDGEDDMEQ